MSERGFDKDISSGGGSFFKLADGDSADILVMDQPLICKVHTIPDSNREYGRDVICGMDDRFACPICENADRLYDSDALRQSKKCFISLYVTTIYRGGGREEVINEHQVASGGTRLYDGFKALHGVMIRHKKNIIGIPLIIQRAGQKQNTQYSVQSHPDADLKIIPKGEAVDVEKLANTMMEKAWEELDYTPTGVHAPAENGAALVGAGVKSSNPTKDPDHDPFAEE